MQRFFCSECPAEIGPPTSARWLARPRLCRACKKRKADARRARWKAKDPEHHLQQMRDWYRANTERHRTLCIANAPAQNARKRARRRVDPAYAERQREHARKNYQRHKPAFVARAAARDRKYKLKGRDGLRYDKRDIRLLNVLQDGCCFWCDQQLPEDFHVDHLIPLSKGGEHHVANFVLSCPTCNLSKHALLPLEFAGRRLQEVA